MKKAGKNTYIPSSAVTVGAWQAIVGQKEKEGPLGKYFDLYSNDEYFGQETYEKAEGGDEPCLRKSKPARRRC